MGLARPVTLKLAHADLSGFPMLFAGVYPWLRSVASGGDVKHASGWDIWFSSDLAGTVALPFERVKWVSTTGACEFWVRVPAVSSTTPTVIYVRYSETGVTMDRQNRNGTWDANYVAVWHFGNGTTLDLTDSTVNANHGTNFGAAAGAGLLSSYNAGGVPIAPEAGGGLVLDGASAYVRVADSVSLRITGATSVESYIQYPSNFDNSIKRRVFEKAKTGAAYSLQLDGGTGFGTTPPLYFRVTGAGGNKETPSGFTVFGGTVGVPNYNACTWDGSATAHAWVQTGINNLDDGNGSPQTWTAPAIGDTTGADLFIGASGGTGSFYLGTLDELRISKTLRSEAWLEASWFTSAYPGDIGTTTNYFYNLGDAVEVTTPTACPPLNAFY